MISRAKAVEGGVVRRTTVHRTRSRFLEVGVRLIKEKPLGLLGAFIVFTLLGIAIFADVIAPYGYAQTSLTHRFRASSAEHWLGTDQLGRDLLSRIIYGTRVSLTVSLGATALGIVLGTLIGVTSAFFGGRYDLSVQRFVDAWESIPNLLLLLTIMSLLGPGLFKVLAVLGRGDDRAGQPHPGRSDLKLPRLWRTTAAPDVGRDAEPAGVELYVSGPLAGHLAWGRPQRRSVRL